MKQDDQFIQRVNQSYLREQMKTKQGININKLLTLCDEHNSIIHKFGIDNKCDKTASICKKGCNENDHMLKTSKHQFINSRQLYFLIASLRSKYQHFNAQFRYSLLKKYINKIKDALHHFQRYVMQDFLDKSPLLNIFCRYNHLNSDIIQQIIEDNLDQVELSQLKCNQVNQLKKLHTLLDQQTQEDQNTRIMKLYSKILENYLRTTNILLPIRMKQCIDKTPEQNMIKFSIIEVQGLQELKKHLDLSINRFKVQNTVEEGREVFNADKKQQIKEDVKKQKQQDTQQYKAETKKVIPKKRQKNDWL